jgi:sulfur relay (sulfurtransferase) DsrF/TusC family protein
MDMGQRHVLVTFNHAPYGSIYYSEGLRAAVGVTSGVDEHSVEILYVGEGVRFALKDTDRRDSARYLATLASFGAKLRVERESLAERKIDEAALAEDVEVVDRRQALELIRRADLTIDF